MWVNPWINASDAFVAAWLPGSEGEGVADVLFAGTERHDFTGRLAFSWPQTAMPVTFDAAGKATGVQFARGWGLDYGSKAASSRLPEDPRIPPHWAAPPGSVFHAGHVTAPWSVFVADEAVEVHLTTSRQESPRGGVVAIAAGDGSTAVWNGTQSALYKISGRAGDLRPQVEQGVAIEMRYRVDRAPERNVAMGLRCTDPLCGIPGGAMLDVTRVFKTSRPGDWRTLSIPLSCFAAAGADLASVEVPLAIETSGRFGITISEAGLVRRNSNTATKCPGTT
jgi:beta-glucosidase